MRYAKLNNGKELWVASTETHKDSEGEVIALTLTTDEGEVLHVSVGELSCWW